MLVTLATMFGCIDSAYAQSAEADASRKLSLAAAKGELSSQQVIVFQEQIRTATKSSTGIARQKRLAEIAQHIERARKQKQVADRLFNWF